MKLTRFKYIILLLPLFSGALHSFGQRRGFDNLTWFDDRKLHFGFYLGLTTMDYRLTNYNNVYDNPVFADAALRAKAQAIYGAQTNFAANISKILPGFTVGGVVNARLGRDLDLRFTPGMSLGDRLFHFYNPSVLDPTITGENPATYLRIKSTYIDLPMGIRYKALRHRNVRPYIYAGGAYRIDLAATNKQDGVVHVKKYGKYAETALGLDSYLEYFRFTVEFRFSYGLDNLIKHDVSTDHIPYYGYVFKEVNSNLFTLIFYFE